MHNGLRGHIKFGVKNLYKFHNRRKKIILGMMPYARSNVLIPKFVCFYYIVPFKTGIIDIFLIFHEEQSFDRINMTE